MSKKRTKKQKRKTRAIVLIIELAVLAVLVIGGLYIHNALGKINTTELDSSKIKTNDVSEDTKKSFEGYTTIAMFGLDNRSTGTYNRGNSDVIMLLNINNDTKSMQIISVYRDSYLNVSSTDTTFHKANYAYAAGGAEQALNMLNTNLDLDIQDYVTFDFATIADGIDVLGGVDVDITSSEELKWLNKYIDHTDGILGTSTEHVYDTGEQTLNGVQAVAYSRIRYTNGSDFKRAQRHRLVLNAMMEKAKSANVSTLNALIQKVLPQIETSLTKSEILEMVPVMVDYSISASRGFPFEKNSINLGGSIGWVDVPCDLTTNVSELHAFMFENESYTPSSTVQEYSDIITNNTGFTRDSASKDEFEDVDSFTGTGSSSSDSSSDATSSDTSNTSDNE